MPLFAMQQQLIVLCHSPSFLRIPRRLVVVGVVVVVVVVVVNFTVGTKYSIVRRSYLLVVVLLLRRGERAVCNAGRIGDSSSSSIAGGSTATSYHIY